ncbi:hydrogen peroxide-inducible genes activator [Ghiorsea bivora]|uniref:hydrogen peroxide-inducible genes activator n=1 Tax=Ghiorsea bivora TaxID=1485545 RepID=UPI001E64FBAF|nr:hydrogen peroxide-inducible genes activator [Ghiorsea bivora]
MNNESQYIAMHNYPTTKQLQCLTALDEFKHFGRAASACHISQSAFSTAIKALEDKLQVQLVDRTNKQLIFTDVGLSVVHQARLCLSELDVLIDLVSSTDAPLSGKITLGVIPSIAPFVLPKFVPQITQAHPDLQLYLREDKTHIVHEQLLAGKLDVILLALPFELQGTQTLILFDDPFLLAYHQHSKWFKDEGKSFNINELPKESLLLLDDGHCLRDHALEACHLRSVEQISRFAATSLQTLLQMVASDLGVTFIPSIAKDSLMVKDSNIQLMPLPKNMHRQIGLAWRKGSSREEEFKLLGEMITACMDNPKADI